MTHKGTYIFEYGIKGPGPLFAELTRTEPQTLKDDLKDIYLRSRDSSECLHFSWGFREGLEFDLEPGIRDY